MEEMSYMFLSFFFCFFFVSLPLISTLVFACISHNLTAATKFSCCSSNEKKYLSVISSYSCLSLFFSLSFAGLVPTVSFSLSFSYISNLWTLAIKLSLIL